MKKLFNLFELAIALIIFLVGSVVHVSAVEVDKYEQELLEGVAKSYSTEFAKLISVRAGNPDESSYEYFGRFSYVEKAPVKEIYERNYSRYLDIYFSKYSDAYINGYISTYFFKRFDEHPEEPNEYSEEFDEYPEELIKISDKYLKDRLYDLLDTFIKTFEKLKKYESLRHALIFLFSFVNSFSSVTGCDHLKEHYLSTSTEALDRYTGCGVRFNAITRDITICLTIRNVDKPTIIDITLDPEKFLSDELKSFVPKWVFERDLPID